MREGWEPTEKKPLISPKMWAMLIGLSLLFGKAFIEAMIGQTVQSFFKGGSHEEPVTWTAPPAAQQTAPRVAQPEWTPSPEPEEDQDAATYSVPVYGTSSVISPRVAIRVLNSGSFSDVGFVWDQTQEAQRKKRKR